LESAVSAKTEAPHGAFHGSCGRELQVRGGRFPLFHELALHEKIQVADGLPLAQASFSMISSNASSKTMVRISTIAQPVMNQRLGDGVIGDATGSQIHSFCGAMGLVGRNS
jgi:hypothetical protein